MQILWFSNAPEARTGYAVTTQLFALGLHKGGRHKVDIAAFFGQEGWTRMTGDGIRIFPRLDDPYGNDIIQPLSTFCKSDLVISLIDAWVLDPDRWGKVPWCAWTPVDSVPVQTEIVAALTGARWVWAMSRFGEAQFKAAGLGDKTIYVPLGTDCAAYKPGNRAEARARVARASKSELTGKFLVFMNAANKGVPSRKGFGYAFEAFKLFSDAHPDAVLYLHTEQFGVMGEHLPLAIKVAGLDPNKVIFSQQFPYRLGLFGPKNLNDMYNAADVLFVPSLAEGFGIPIVEAQAAGCPVIVTDFSSMPELCFSGWKVPGMLHYHTVGAQQMIPDIGQLVAALEAAYQVRGNEALRAETSTLVQHYDYRRVMDDYMYPALERMGRELEQRKTRRQKRLEKRQKAEQATPLASGGEKAAR